MSNMIAQRMISVVVGCATVLVMATGPATAAAGPQIRSITTNTAYTECPGGRVEMWVDIARPDPSVYEFGLEAQLSIGGKAFKDEPLDTGPGPIFSLSLICTTTNRADHLGQTFTYRLRATAGGLAGDWYTVNVAAKYEDPGWVRHLRLHRTSSTSMRITWRMPKESGGIYIEDYDLVMQQVVHLGENKVRLSGHCPKLHRNDKTVACTMRRTSPHPARVRAKVFVTNDGGKESYGTTSRWITL